MAQTETDGLEVLETSEWVDSLDYVLSKGGPVRAGRLIQQLELHARRAAGDSSVRYAEAFQRVLPQVVSAL